MALRPRDAMRGGVDARCGVSIGVDGNRSQLLLVGREPSDVRSREGHRLCFRLRPEQWLSGAGPAVVPRCLRCAWFGKRWRTCGASGLSRLPFAPSGLSYRKTLKPAPSVHFAKWAAGCAGTGVAGFAVIGSGPCAPLDLGGGSSGSCDLPKAWHRGLSEGDATIMVASVSRRLRPSTGVGGAPRCCRGVLVSGQDNECGWVGACASSR